MVVRRERAVDGVFREYDGIVVREGNAVATGVCRRLCHSLRRGPISEAINLFRFRDVPVLTEPAPQIAASSAERENARAGIKMVQRLLFDRIDAKPGCPSVAGQRDAASPRLSYKTEPPLAVPQLAIPWTQVALNPPILQPMPPVSLDDARRDDSSRGHIW